MAGARRKVVASGNVIEVWEYENPVWYDFGGSGGRKKKGEGESIRALENRALTCRRAREKVRRLALSNFDSGSKFMTLTFAENMTDVEKGNYEFKKFVQRLRRRWGDFKYLAVIEFQERGAVHYHMMADLPYIPNQDLREKWGHGFVKINEIAHVDNVGAYMVKYMLKDLDDPRLMGQRSFLYSRNLDGSVVIRGEAADSIVQALETEHKKEVFASSYTSEHHGKILYREYNLARGENLPEAISEATENAG